MSGMNRDQLHRSTLGIYANLMDEFNPSLQKLVSLGNRYSQAFQALAATSEDYFSTLSKIGEKAFHTKSSKSLGDALIQMSESQRVLTMEMERVFRWFNTEVLQEMEKNIRLDKDYLLSSRKYYEMEVQSQATAVERQTRRGIQDDSGYMQFLKKSYGDILKEQERRHRFLAEKHCSLIQSIAQLMNKTGGSLQQRADAWTKEVNATREVGDRRLSSVDNSIGMRNEEIRKSREEMTLGKIPSRAPSPQGSIANFRIDSGGGGGRSVRALVDHQPGGSNSTLLAFSKGEIITVRTKEPKNGWLYGRADGTSRQGWFPSTYVEAVDDPPSTVSSPGIRLRSVSSMSNLQDQPVSRNQSIALAPAPAPAPPPPPPPPPPPSSNGQAERKPTTPTPDRRAESNPDTKRPKPQDSRPELFPRGTNPFATVKLKPTVTNDKSAPRLYRR